MVDQAGAPWVCPHVLCYRCGDWGGRPSLLGSRGQGEEDAAYRGLDLGRGHEPKALRSSATEQPGLSVQDKEWPCPPVPTSVSSLPTWSPHAISKQQLGGRRKGKWRRREVGLSGPQVVFLSLTVGLTVPLGSCLLSRGSGPV